MDLTYKQEVGVGAFVLVGVVLFVVGMFWLTGRAVSAGGVTARVVFANVAGLKDGAPVYVSGVKKGQVLDVHLDRVGHVTVTVQLQSDVRPRVDAHASVAASDFFGGRYLDYSPGVSGQFLPSNGVIEGEREPDITDVAAGIAGRADSLLGNATALVNARLGQDIHNTLVATQRAMNVLAQTGEGPLVQQTTATLAAAARLMNHLDSLTVQGTGQRVDTLTRNLNQLSGKLAEATGNLNALLARVDSGRGTIGRMATDTTLYADLHQTLTALTALLTDLKARPGRYLTVKVF